MRQLIRQVTFLLQKTITYHQMGYNKTFKIPSICLPLENPWRGRDTTLVQATLKPPPPPPPLQPQTISLASWPSQSKPSRNRNHHLLPHDKNPPHRDERQRKVLQNLRTRRIRSGIRLLQRLSRWGSVLVRLHGLYHILRVAQMSNSL